MFVGNRSSRELNLSLKYESFIGGRFRGAYQQDRIDVLSPINGSILYDVPEAGEIEINAAVKYAGIAQKKWEACPAAMKSQILRKIAATIREHQKIFAEIEVNDTGKLTKYARNEVELAAQYFDYFASCIVTQEGSAANVYDVLSINLYQPLGTVAIILPWNFPLLMFSWKVVPALAAGNAVIVKPSEYASLSIIQLMELIKTIVPKGLINVLLGSGHVTGERLINSTGIDKIFFTGGTETGKHIAVTANSQLIPLSMELGGKSPCIITSNVLSYGDAYISQVISGILQFTYNQGQVCGCLSRLLVHRTVYENVLEILRDRLDKTIVGDPRDKTSCMGPVISFARKGLINTELRKAKLSGAKITSFEHCIKISDNCRDGFYFPAVIVEGDHSMEIFHKELFGPVLCCEKFDTLEEAIKLANSTNYGLAAGIWSRDIKEVNYLTKHLVAGKIWINASHIYYPHTKFGGVKQSGSGNEMHKISLHEYQYIKNIIQYY